MVGFSDIFISKSYDKEDFNIRNLRFACIARKKLEDKPSVYYEKQIKNSDYFIGGST